jgi:hypothetical protein
MGFLSEIYTLQQVQHVCPVVTILDVFVASNIDLDSNPVSIRYYLIRGSTRCDLSERTERTERDMCVYTE